MTALSEAESLTDRNPTHGQIHAGNYRKGKYRIHGMRVSIENPRGSIRSAKDGSWKVRMPAAYGYILGTEGADQDHVDCFVGPHSKSPLVYVVDQKDADSGRFDEHKCFIGFASPQQVKNTYHAAFSDGRGKDRLGQLHEMTVSQFKEWLKDGETHKPFKRAEGGRIALADGGDASGPWSDYQSSSEGPWNDYAKPVAQTPSSGGLSSYIPSAISDIPSEAYHAAKENVMGAADAWGRIRERHAQQAEADKNGAGFFSGMTAPFQDVADVGRAAVSAASVPFSPVVGAARSLIGHPMASLEHGIGSIINPEAAAKDDPAKMYENAKHDVDLALSAARPRGFTGPAFTEAMPPTSPLVTPEAQANRALASEFDIPLSRGQATQDLDRIRYEDMASRGAYGPEAQERAAQFFNDQFAAIQRAGRGVGEQFGHGEQPIASPADAASSLNTTIADRAAAARQARDAVIANAEREAAAQRQMATDREQAITQAIAGNHPTIESPREAGEIVSQNLRDQAQAHRDEFRRLYQEFGNLPGEFDVQAVRGMGSRIRQDLTYRDEPVIIDEGTPTASRAIQALDTMSQPRITNLADPLAPPAPEEITGVNLRGIDQMRKRLVGYYQQARSSNNASDIRATRSVLNGFDDQIEQAISNNLFSGDPRALQALQEARGSFARYQRTYNPQRAGDDVGTAMRRIVDRNATPEETANLIIGSGKIGNAGLPVRIADRLEQTLGADSQAWNSIRQAMWQRASRVRNSAGEVDPVRSAASIADFTNSTLARRMFSPEELAAMRNHAQAVRDLDRTIETLPETQAAEQARTSYENAFGGNEFSGSQRQAFRRMVEGTATPEETAQAMFSTIAGGNPGNASRALNAIAQIVGEDSPTMGAIRQGVWQKLIQNPYGKDAQGQQKMVQGINEFLNGKGRTIARQLYSPEERALMARYAEAVRKTIIPKYARTNSDTAPALLAAVRKYAGALGAALGFGIEGGHGGITGYGAGKILDKVGEKIQGAVNMKRLNESLEDLTPAAPKALPPPKAKSAARTAVLAAQSTPNVNIGSILRQFQGTIPAGAEEKHNKSNRKWYNQPD